jgi:hypothetical protein
MEMMYRWAQRGYISPDSAVTSESPDTLFSSGNHLGMMYWHNEKNLNTYISSSKMELSSMRLVEHYVVNGGGNPIMWRQIFFEVRILWRKNFVRSQAA